MYPAGVSGHTHQHLQRHDIFFSSEDLEKRCSTALKLLEVFIRRYKDACAPFKNGEAHRLNDWNVSWDAGSGGWRREPD